VNCEQVEEYISALCDGEKIPRDAAGHLGTCQKCQLELSEYSSIGVELRRLASMEDAGSCIQAEWAREMRKKQISWWEKGLMTMKIPRLAFGVMLIAIIALSGDLVLLRARAGATGGRFVELKYKLSPTDKDICVMRADGSQKDNLCNFVHHGHQGVLLMNTRVMANFTDHVQVAIRAKYIPGADDIEVNYNETLFKDIPENVLSLVGGEKQEIQVAGLGPMEVEGEYLDHIPPLVYRPQETLDPNPREFRVVAPVLVRDNQVVAKADGSSIETGSADATLMLYIPGEGRYLVSVIPFEGAVEGAVHLGQIAFALEKHDYLLLTSMPITVSEHVWVKHEPDFKPSERMARTTDARDDRLMFLVRSLETLQKQRIPH
jgi:hypothetical protein